VLLRRRAQRSAEATAAATAHKQQRQAHAQTRRPAVPTNPQRGPHHDRRTRGPGGGSLSRKFAALQRPRGLSLLGARHCCIIQARRRPSRDRRRRPASADVSHHPSGAPEPIVRATLDKAQRKQAASAALCADTKRATIEAPTCAPPPPARTVNSSVQAGRLARSPPL
jgi:hypothetical protein